MEFRRALRILAARWWVVLLIAVLGVAASLAFATWSNGRIEPDYEATAPVTFERFADTDAAFSARLERAARTARNALSVRLSDAASDVETDVESGELRFIARATDPVAASDVAQEFRAVYLAVEPSATNDEQIRTELTELEEQITQIRSELIPASNGPAIDPVVEAQRSLLAAQISSLEQRAASLTLQLAYPDLAEGEGADLQSELDLVESLLRELAAGLVALPTAPSPTEPSLDNVVLSRRLENLEEDYVTLALRLLEESAEGGRLDSVRLSDETPAEINRSLAGVAGLGGGIVTALILLLLIDRIRRPIWGLEDLRDSRPYGSIARARPGARSHQPWYPTATGTHRREDLQVLRAALDRRLQESDIALGVTGVATRSRDVQSLAADLAASLASSGRRVLLIDADFKQSAQLPEFGIHSTNLKDLVARNGGEDSAVRIKRCLSDLPENLPDFTALRAGDGADREDPVDALAGPRFRHVLSAAAELDRIVVVALPEPGTPVADLMSQRLSHMLVVVARRRATQTDVEAAVGDLADRNAELLGTVLLQGRRNLRWALRNNLKQATGKHQGGRRRSKTKATAESPAPLEQQEAPERTNDPQPPPAGGIDASTSIVSPLPPSPDNTVQTSASPTTGTSETPTSRSTEPSSGEHFGGARHRALPEPELTDGGSSHRVGRRTSHGTTPERRTDRSNLAVIIDDRSPTAIPVRIPQAARDRGERYLVDQVSMLLGFAPTKGALAAGLVDAEGIVSLTPDAGSPTAAERLIRVLRDNDPRRSPALDDVLTEILDEHNQPRPIAHWIEQYFFTTHVRLSLGRPDIWHLTSPSGAFQVLIRGDSFDAEGVSLLRRREVRPTLGNLKRRAKHARFAGKPAAELDQRVREVQAYDGALASLAAWPGEGSGPARWLKVLRRRGLLARADWPADIDPAE